MKSAQSALICPLVLLTLLLCFSAPVRSVEATLDDPEPCRADLLGPPDASGISCHGPWAYQYFPCYRALRHPSCGVEEYEKEEVEVYGTCRHRDFGVERWEQVARVPLPRMGFPNSAPQDVDREQLERHARQEAASLAMLLNTDGERYLVEVVDGVLENPQEYLKQTSLWPRAKAFDEIHLWLEAMGRDAWYQGFHYNKGRRAQEEAHGRWHHQHKGNIELRVRCLRQFFTSDFHYWARKQNFDLAIFLPVYHSRQDSRCGAATFERDTTVPLRYRECRHQDAGPEATNICSVPASVEYGNRGDVRHQLPADRAPWWDRQDGGAWCTTCDYTDRPEEKVRCLHRQIDRSRADHRPEEEIADLVKRAKFAFEVVIDSGDESRSLHPHERAKYLAFAQEHPWEHLCGTSLGSLEETPPGVFIHPDVGTASMLEFCHRLGLPHASPSHARKFLALCGAVGMQVTEYNRSIAPDNDIGDFLHMLNDAIAARAAQEGERL